MSMADQHVLDALLLLEAKLAGQSTGIDGELLTEKKARRAVLGSLTPVAAEDCQFGGQWGAQDRSRVGRRLARKTLCVILSGSDVPLVTRSIHFISLGCAKNRVDTEVMLGVSDTAGLQLVDDPAQAEVIVVNTCGFIDAAKQESIDTILAMAQQKQQGRCQTLVVAGCLSQRYADQLADELPEVDHFLGSSDMLKLQTVIAGSGPRMLVGNPAEYVLRASDPRRLSQQPHSVYVKIAEGCNRTCSFCAIPAIRGAQRSRPVWDIVAEVEQLAAQGTVEINLVSQDTIAYGRELTPRASLAEMVAAVAEVQGIRWVRLHYLYPESLEPRLVELLASHPKVLPYVDMPLQHVSDTMLTRMRRGHGGQRIYRLVEKLRATVPDLVFRSTFIVGHPGESEEDFEALCAFVRWAELDHIGIFRFSAEEGTHSIAQSDAVNAVVGQRRQRKLMSIQRDISRAKLQLRVGQTIEVLIDGVSSESELLLEGRHAGQALEVDGKVILANGVAAPGEFRQALVTGHSDYDLVADLLGRDGEHQTPLRARTTRSGRVHLRTVA